MFLAFPTPFHQVLYELRFYYQQKSRFGGKIEISTSNFFLKTKRETIENVDLSIKQHKNEHLQSSKNQKANKSQCSQRSF